MLKISDKHKTIFWHIHKTGGSYIEYILGRYYDFHTNWEKTIKIENEKIKVQNKIFIENEDDFEEHVQKLKLILDRRINYTEEIDIKNKNIKKLLETNNPTIDWDKKEYKIVDKSILTDFINPEEIEIEIENEIIKIILFDKKIWDQNEKNKFGLFGEVIKEDINKKLINIPIEKWQTYFKFCVVRNPYDRAISSFEYLKQKDRIDNRLNPLLDKEECDFKYFFKNENQLNTNAFMHYHAYATQVYIIKDELNNIKMDYIAKFENLEEEVIEILKKIGINEFPHLNLVKENIKVNITKKKNLDKYFDQTTLEIINEKFKEDFETFGYKIYTNVEELNNYLLELNDENLINKKKIDLLNKYENNLTENRGFVEKFLLEREEEKNNIKYYPIIQKYSMTRENRMW